VSLTSAMLIGRSGLDAASAGIQVASNNIANAASPGYSRQIAHLRPVRGSNTSGVGSIGSGVGVSDIERQVDQALLARYWNGLNTEAAALQESAILNQVEGSLNELTGTDLSSKLSGFFNLWSERANLSESSAVVLQQGAQLADMFQRLRGSLSDTRTQVDNQLSGAVDRANQLLDQIAQVNREVGAAEGGAQQANALRDRRDELVSELAALVDVSVVEQSNGLYDVLVGSTPLVLGGTARNIELRLTSDGTTERADVAVSNGGSLLDIEAGILGGLLASRRNGIDRAIDDLDRIASELIFQVNQISATASNTGGYTDASGTLTIAVGDRMLALNDPTNASLAGLPFGASNGGFLVQVTNTATGEVSTTRVDVDLDGLTDAGVAGFADDTSAEDIRASLDAINGLSASFAADGRLLIESDPVFSFAFGDDSSNALATLGVNSYFEGSSAANIAVRSDLIEDPSRLGSGSFLDGVFIENGAALGIAGLAEQPIEALSGEGFRGAWQSVVSDIAGNTAAAADRAAGATIVRENLEAQRSAVSGVNLDEESINLLTYQRLYQGSARVIQTASDLLDTLLSIV